MLNAIVTFLYNVTDLLLTRATFILDGFSVSFLSIVLAISCLSFFISVFWKGGKK